MNNKILYLLFNIIVIIFTIFLIIIYLDNATTKDISQRINNSDGVIDYNITLNKDGTSYDIIILTSTGYKIDTIKYDGLTEKIINKVNKYTNNNFSIK